MVVAMIPSMQDLKKHIELWFQFTGEQVHLLDHLLLNDGLLALFIWWIFQTHTVLLVAVDPEISNALLKL
jgi:hypothetical protein